MKSRNAIAIGVIAFASLLSVQAQAANWNISDLGLDGAVAPGSSSGIGKDNTAPNPSGYDSISLTGARTQSTIVRSMTGMVGSAGGDQAFLVAPPAISTKTVARP